MSDPQPEYAFTAEYPCDKHCRVEVDLTATHRGFTHRQMQAAARDQHERQHPEIAPPRSTRRPLQGAPIHDMLEATFQAPASS
jgi:hypothetical protein